jgi:hypothetical protein
MARPKPRAKFRQGVDGLTERTREQEIAYASTRIRPFSLASSPAGYPLKWNSPNSHLLRQRKKQNSAMKITNTIGFHKCLKQNDCSFTWPHGPYTNIQIKKGPGAQRSSGLRSISVGGVREQELLEGLGERIGGISG